ncbi:hypothetical protein PACTADRAFT_51440 [Pachysolen tannophilus NRRL Y-2460]|uniref:M-phase inducer phosphatase n=1 Tax=Pachysolen tannophilus NRRL Y-2460 TaxID=669874 RepID=A0A1E4TPJ7_PACTA|nr:hypothetical protein PACTADRAFT_51440 [Pachysolen tannophilus NRRL Y-2460]
MDDGNASLNPSSSPFLKNINSKRKTRHDLPYLSITSFKRQLSPLIDSPTTILADQLSENFHIEKHSENLLVPKKVSPDRSKNVAQASLDSFSTQSDKTTVFRPPLSLLTNQQNLSSASSLNCTSLQNSPSCSSASSNVSPASSFHLHTNSNATTTSLGSITSNISTISSSKTKFSLAQRKAIRRDGSGLNHRNASLINGSLFYAARSHSISSSSTPSFVTLDNNLDSFCVPSPVPNKINPFPSVSPKHDKNSSNEETSPLKQENGSPLQQRTSIKKGGSRLKVRRTQSMFQNPQELCFGSANDNNNSNNINNNINNNNTLNQNNNNNNKNSCFENSLRGNSTLSSTAIKTFHVKSDLLPRIDVDQFVKILDGEYKVYFDEVFIVDCRFEYEFNGGHIEGAINISSQADLESFFLSEEKLAQAGIISKPNNKLVIFHCEFSSYRGPLIANHLRKTDRILNKDNYPNLCYPDILILEGGYKNFFDLQSHRCFPKYYVEMNDSKHQVTCERELSRFRRDAKLRSSSKSLQKAKSFHSLIPSLATTHNRSFSNSVKQLKTNSSISPRPKLGSSQSLFGTFGSKMHSAKTSSYSSRHSSSSFSIFNDSMSISNRDSLDSAMSDMVTASEGGITSFFSGKRNINDESSFFENRMSTSSLSEFLEEQQQQQQQGQQFPPKLDFGFRFPAPKNNIYDGNKIVKSGAAQDKIGIIEKSKENIIISHKKQKSSKPSLMRSLTQPNYKFNPTNP